MGVRRATLAGFAPVRKAAEPLPASMLAPGTIEVEFANGSRIRITGSVDPAALAAAVSALSGAERR
jgi:transposase